MLYRPLPNTDVSLSIIGFGGVVLSRRPQDECDAEVAHAIDRGITYFDVAPQYANAQQLMGPALKPFRKDVFLACKTLERKAEDAARELDDSLSKLCTDHFDLYQLHSLKSAEEAHAALGPGGAIETLLQAREQGKARFLGASCHDEEAALVAARSGHFTTIMLPLNFASYEIAGFGPRLVAEAAEHGVSLIALKATAKGKLRDGWENRPYDKCWYEPADTPELAALHLRFALNLPGVVATLPPGEPSLFRMCLDQVDAGLPPLTEAELTELADFYAQPATAPLFPQDPD
ncbi:MAG: aldo/keto reductase [Planctomycetota bacterium]